MYFLLSLIISVAPLMCEIAPFDEMIDLKKKKELTKITNLS